MKRRHETDDDSIEDVPGKLSCRWIACVARVAAEVEQERGRPGRYRNPGACSLEGRERLDEEMSKLGRAVTRRCIDPSLGSVRRDVRSELMTMWNTENLMERPRVDVLVISTELERQPPAPYVVGGIFEDAHRFGRCLNGSDAELVQPVLERASATRNEATPPCHERHTMPGRIRRARLNIEGPRREVAALPPGRQGRAPRASRSGLPGLPGHR